MNFCQDECKDIVTQGKVFFLSVAKEINGSSK